MPRKEQRHHPRYELQGIGGTLRYDMNARVLNLSLDGMALETSAWLHVGKSYRLRVGAGDDAVDLDGTVVWCHLLGSRGRGDGGPVYQAGVHFGETLSEKAQRLLSFIRRAGVIGVVTRVFGRFKLRREEAVDVAFEHHFEVRRLSVSGLLIEADLLPEVGARFVLEVDTPFGPLSPTVVVRSLEQGRTAEGQPTSHIGVAFDHLAADDRRVLEQVIAQQLAAGAAVPVEGSADARG
jgi:hypothetical protein